MFHTLGSPLHALTRLVPVAPLAILAALTLFIGGCGGGSGSPLATTPTSNVTCDPTDPATASECGKYRESQPPAYPRVLPL